MSYPLISGGRYSHAAGSAIGTTVTVTVPSGANVTGLTCIATTAAGSLVITPGGANQSAVAQPTIPIPVNTSFEPPSQSMFQQLGGGTTLAFTNVDAYIVTYNKAVVGS